MNITSPADAGSSPAVLIPGDYLLELELLSPVSRSTVLTALYNAGFREFHLDPAFGGISAAYGEGEPSKGARTRIISTLTERAQVANIPGKVKWTLIHPLRISPRTERAAKISGAKEMLALETGKIYESRLLTQNKSFPTRERVWTALRVLGYEPLKLIEMKRQMRLPNLPGSLWSTWLVWSRWLGQSGVFPQQPMLVFDETVQMP